jgi:chromosomal replication initiator protein
MASCGRCGVRLSCDCSPDYSRPLEPRRAFAAVASVMKVAVATLRAKDRRAYINEKRQTAMYLIGRLCGIGFREVGLLFRRDHSTVIHATAATTARMNASVEFATEVRRCEREVAAAAEQSRAA